MNRPQKKKPSNPLLPEDDNVVDERNLIDIEESADISFEDKVNVYWMENKGFIMGCITALLLVVVGYQAMGILKDNAEASLQASFAEAQASETLAEFAKENPGKELGGVAALMTADAAYTEKDFAKAIEFYSIAVEGLGGNLLEGRAHLGKAFALYENGSEAEGLALLNAIIANNNLAEASRAEAAYHLAVEAYANERSSEFESYAAQIESIELAGQWKQRLEVYKQSAP